MTLRLRMRKAARPLAATAAFTAIVAGLWLERPSLALLIPGTIIFALLVYSHVLGVKPDA